MACANEFVPSMPESETNPLPELAIVPIPGDIVEEGIDRRINVPHLRNDDAYDEQQSPVKQWKKWG